MAVQLTEIDSGKILEAHVSGTLNVDDYKRFVPEFERLVRQHGKISVLFEMKDFHGWGAGALWQDLKFDFKHFADIERLAMVGDKHWERWMSDFCRPFTTAKIRYFDKAESEAARHWITGQPDKVPGKTPSPIVP